MASNHKFGGWHIVILVGVAIGMGALASNCGPNARHNKPEVCSTNSAGEQHCSLQTGRQHN